MIVVKTEILEAADEYIKIVSSAKSSCNDAAKSISALRLQLSESWNGASGNAMEQALAAIQMEIIGEYNALDEVESAIRSRTKILAYTPVVPVKGGFGGSGGRDKAIFDEDEQKVLEDTFKEIYGKDVYYGVKVYEDISTGSVSWDTLENTLKAFGVKSAIVDAVVTSCKTITNPSKKVKARIDRTWAYADSANHKLANGDIIGGVADLGMTVMAAAQSVRYTASDILTEVGANIMDGAAETVSSALKASGKYVPGVGGKILKTAGNTISTVSDNVTGWIRKLF